MDAYASAQLHVEVVHPLGIFGLGLDVYLFSGKLGHVSQDRVALVGPLHEHLAGDGLLPAIDHLFLEVVADRHRIGDEIDLALVEHLDQLGIGPRHFQLQREAVRLGEVFRQVMLVAHGLHLVLEIGGGAVEGRRDNLASGLDPRPIRRLCRGCLIGRALMPATAEEGEATEQ